LLAIPLATPNFADDPPPQGDLDGDDVKDPIEPDPNPPGPVPGEVEIRSGANGTLIVTIRGQQPNDRFGYSVAVIDDLNSDGFKDLLIGAPLDTAGTMSASTGRAYVFHGPFLDTGPMLITANNAEYMFFAPHPGEFSFGDRVAPVSDIDGDGVTDIRIRCWYLDANQVETMRTYFASGLTGALLFVVNGQEPFDPWQEVPGDTDGDGDVDQVDLDTVIANLGLVGDPGSLSPFDGDLNGDGIVDGLDFAIVQANLGAIFTPHPVPCEDMPSGYHCTPDCDALVHGMPGNLSYDCGAGGIGIPCIPCGPITTFAPVNLDINTEVTLGHPHSHYTVLYGAERIEILSGPNWNTFRFRPIEFGLVKFRDSHSGCESGDCGAIYQYFITCLPVEPVEITPSVPYPIPMSVCVLTPSIQLVAEGNWGEGQWDAGAGVQLIDALDGWTSQMLDFTPRHLGQFDLRVTNSVCGLDSEDLVRIRIVWIDSDGDGLPDGLETALGLNPLSVDSDGNGIVDGAEDNDGDGLTNGQEVVLGFYADDDDTDNDGTLDGNEDPEDGDGGIGLSCPGFQLNGILFNQDSDWHFNQLPDVMNVCGSDQILRVRLHAPTYTDNDWIVLAGAPCVVIDGDPSQDRISPDFVIDRPCIAQNGGRVILAGMVTSPETGEVCLDTVELDLAQVDIDIDSNNDGAVNDVDDEIELAPPGRFVRFNNDDDNQNGTPDHTESGAIPGEDDLVPLSLTVPNSQPGYRWRLTFPSSKIRIWLTTERSDGVISGLPRDMPAPATVFIEGIATSAQAGDVSITLELDPPPDGEPCIPDTVSLTVVKVQLKSVTFAGSLHPVTQDTGAAYSAPHWLDANGDGDANDAPDGDHKSPIAYAQGTSIRVEEVRAIFEPSNFPIQGASMKGIVEDLIVYADDSLVIDNNHLVADAMDSAAQLPAAIAYWPESQIQWELHLSEHLVVQTGRSTNTLYVTLANPTVSPLYHTVVHRACKHAAGQTTAQGAVNGIWAYLQGMVVQNFEDQPPAGFGYWRTGNPPITTQALITSFDGRCRAWARLLRDALKVHGVSARCAEVLPDATLPNLPPGSVASGILVKNWNMTGSQPLPLPGVAGQGGVADPESAFANHGLMELGGMLYDPSYGTGPYPTLLAWQQASLDAVLFEHNGTQFSAGQPGPNWSLYTTIQSYEP